MGAPVGGDYNNKITQANGTVKSESTEKASLAVQFKMTESGATRTFELGDATARMIGNTVDLNGGTIRQRVLQTIVFLRL